MKNYWTQSANNIYVAAHRGWSSDYPENTMEAFEAAARIGVDQIETDVRITRDGELVLMHDKTVDRTTNGSGLVRDMTLSQIRSLDAGIRKDARFRGARVPTFTEFMEFVKDLPDMTIDVELKEYPTDGWEETAYSVCDRVLRMIDEYGYTERCVINTFSGALHEYIFKTYGSKYKQHVYFPIEKMGACTIDPYTYGYCVCMFGEHIMATRSEFEQMRSKGIRTWAGAAVKDAEGVELAARNGAELITCNNPDVILALLRERHLHK